MVVSEHVSGGPARFASDILATLSSNMPLATHPTGSEHDVVVADPRRTGSARFDSDILATPSSELPLARWCSTRRLRHPHKSWLRDAARLIVRPALSDTLVAQGPQSKISHIPHPIFLGPPPACLLFLLPPPASCAFLPRFLSPHISDKTSLSRGVYSRTSRPHLGDPLFVPLILAL